MNESANATDYKEEPFIRNVHPKGGRKSCKLGQAPYSFKAAYQQTSASGGGQGRKLPLQLPGKRGLLKPGKKKTQTC